MINNLLQVKKIKDKDLYKLIEHFPSSLNLDIGGFVGNQAIDLCRDKHRVKTFEPFENNIKFYITSRLNLRVFFKNKFTKNIIEGLQRLKTHRLFF